MKDKIVSAAVGAVAYGLLAWIGFVLLLAVVLVVPVAYLIERTGRIKA